MPTITDLASWDSLRANGGAQLYSNGTQAWSGPGTALLKRVYDELKSVPDGPAKLKLEEAVRRTCEFSAVTSLPPASSPDFPEFGDYQAAMGTVPPAAPPTGSDPFAIALDLNGPATVGMVRALGSAVGELGNRMDAFTTPPPRGPGRILRAWHYMNGR